MSCQPEQAGQARHAILSIEMMKHVNMGYHIYYPVQQNVTTDDSMILLTSIW